MITRDSWNSDFPEIYTMKPLSSPDRKALSTLNNNVVNVSVSPTANLKLLTKVASELASPVPYVEVNPRNEKDPKTRKDKSLGILCDRFLAMFPLDISHESQVMEICLDRVSNQLGIVKRRIYDIINILESLKMASKVAKNRYHWHGRKNLQATLSQLKSMAVEWGIDKKLMDIQDLQKSGARLVSGPTCCYYGSNDISTASEGDSTRSRDLFFSDERTLGVMCLKFIMLFLASPQSSAKVNLDLASRMLISEAAEGDWERQQWGMKLECHKRMGEETCDARSKSCRCMLRLKTKVRRLYDIANVLTSLKLIAKIESPTNSMRKPVFVYTGPVVELSPLKANQSYLKSFITTSSFEEDSNVVEQVGSMNRKRKDFISKNGPSEKLPRILSDHNLAPIVGCFSSPYNVSSRHVSSAKHQDSNLSHYQCSLDDILHVAGQELEKIRSSEEMATAQKAAGARKKLSFSRSHSDSCIPPSVVQESVVQVLQDLNPTTLSQNSSGSEVGTKKSICVNLNDAKSKRFTITRKLVEVPSHVLPKKLLNEPALKVHNITPLQAQTLSTLFGIPHHKLHPHDKKPDCNQLLSCVGADLKNNNIPTVQPMTCVTSNSVDRGVNSLNCTVTSANASGELYRAIKVGNVVRLVPLITTFGAKLIDQRKE